MALYTDPPYTESVVCISAPRSLTPLAWSIRNESLALMHQFVPQRYLVPFDAPLKDVRDDLFQGNVLDWPRHWRATRKTDARGVVRALNTLPSATVYYDNTVRMIDASDALAGMFDGPEETRICSAYLQFSAPELSLRARAVRRIPVNNREQ